MQTGQDIPFLKKGCPVPVPYTPLKHQSLEKTSMKRQVFDVMRARDELTRSIAAAMVRSERLNQRIGRESRWPSRVRDALLDALVILQTDDGAGRSKRSTGEQP